MEKVLKIIGYGSQAQAWAKCLRSSGWEVSVLLHHKSNSFLKAQKDQFRVDLLSDWKSAHQKNTSSELIAFLCPDDQISIVYEEYFASLSECCFTFLVAHGYCVYSGLIQLNKNYESLNNKNHSWALFAPKAIGPKILENHQQVVASGTGSHELAAAVCTSEVKKEWLVSFAQALRFSEHNLVWTEFETETIGDLISEQILLCGGVFSLLLTAYEEMEKAGVPPRLIREECLTELSLVSDLLRQLGGVKTSEKISQAAQCGAALVYEDFESSEFKKNLQNRASRIRSKEFVKDYNNKIHWKEIQKKWISKVGEFEKEIS